MTKPKPPEIERFCDGCMYRECRCREFAGIVAKVFVLIVLAILGGCAVWQSGNQTGWTEGFEAAKRAMGR